MVALVVQEIAQLTQVDQAAAELGIQVIKLPAVAVHNPHNLVGVESTVLVIQEPQLAETAEEVVELAELAANGYKMVIMAV